MAKIRLDDLLVQRGLAADRKAAAAMLLGGCVKTADGSRLTAGQRVAESIELQVVTPDCPYVSRGGLKLEGALRALKISPRGFVCLDLGSSTGGFSDCLLKQGALRVHAFDVGKGLLDWNLRQDPRIHLREGFNVRFLKYPDVGEDIDLVVADLSFISLKLIFPALKEFPSARYLLLVKPQFEARPEEVGAGGVIRDTALQGEIVARVESQAKEAGFRLIRRTESPIPGQKGNREYFILLELDR